MDLVNAFAEILVIAQEFERNPLEIRISSLGPTAKWSLLFLRQNLLKDRKRAQLKDPIQQVISTVQQIEALARKLFRAKMPKGQPWGPPPPVR